MFYKSRPPQGHLSEPAKPTLRPEEGIEAHVRHTSNIIADSKVVVDLTSRVLSEFGIGMKVFFRSTCSTTATTDPDRVVAGCEPSCGVVKGGKASGEGAIATTLACSSGSSLSTSLLTEDARAAMVLQMRGSSVGGYAWDLGMGSISHRGCQNPDILSYRIISDRGCSASLVLGLSASCIYIV